MKPTNEAPKPEVLERSKVLLGYAVEHNDAHIDELVNLLDTLPPKARKRLQTAIGSFEAANVELQQVLDCLE